MTPNKLIRENKDLVCEKEGLWLAEDLLT